MARSLESGQDVGDTVPDGQCATDLPRLVLLAVDEVGGETERETRDEGDGHGGAAR